MESESKFATVHENLRNQGFYLKRQRSLRSGSTGVASITRFAGYGSGRLSGYTRVAGRSVGPWRSGWSGRSLRAGRSGRSVGAWFAWRASFAWVAWGAGWSSRAGRSTGAWFARWRRRSFARSVGRGTRSAWSTGGAGFTELKLFYNNTWQSGQAASITRSRWGRGSLSNVGNGTRSTATAAAAAAASLVLHLVPDVLHVIVHHRQRNANGQNGHDAECDRRIGHESVGLYPRIGFSFIGHVRSSNKRKENIFVRKVIAYIQFSEVESPYHQNVDIKTPDTERRYPYPVFLKYGRVITRALLARFFFVGHSVLAIWQLVDVSGKSSFWALTAISCSILAEGMLIILSRQGQEAKWFCTSVFLYLCSIVPAVWYLQLNLTVWPHGDPKKTYLESALQVSRELWVQIISQTILVTLIIGRWMLPKGDITREQLSQILLAYLAICKALFEPLASDIVEMFDTFKEPIIRQAPKLPYAVLTVWTLSLAQFPFVMTTSRARKMRVAITQSNSDEE
uniref:Transmembrane protein n=1 Tax=Romanomermis culicivorax TaxID=13658 RepID=A0A915JUM5_ROMCU